MESVIIGIDLGGTNLRIGAVTPDNRMLAPRVMKSSIVADAKNPIGKICEIITGYIEQNQLENVEAISIGVPSSVENDKETVICTTNIRNRAGEVVFSHTNMAKDVREHFQIPVFINNDLSFYEKTVLRIGLGDPDLPGENQECPFQAFESDQNIRIWNTADSYNSP